MRIALFTTCFNDTLFPATGRAAVTVLERLGHTVDVPPGQTCCGQLHVNTGYRPESMPLVRRFADTFATYDVIVTPSASCVGMVRDNHPLLTPRGVAVAGLGGGRVFRVPGPGAPASPAPPPPGRDAGSGRGSRRGHR